MTQIKATIIADSYSAVNGKRITTFELVYPRFIHSELMTHRMFSRNAMSSRAVPIEKMIEQVHKNPSIPIHWGKNQAGMQAKEELGGEDLVEVMQNWGAASSFAGFIATSMAERGAHKQIVNRILEPFQLMKTVLTSTEWENFYWLRNHEDAQPEIKRLAELMYGQQEANRSSAIELDDGDWHTPYYEAGYWMKEHQDTIGWYDKNGVSLEDALAISSSCCAQVSYRLLDDSLEKARMIYKRLVESEPVHASPFEHCATPMKEPNQPDKYLWEDGITHMDRDGNMWSGNFRHWVQYRQLIPNNVKKG